jgi:adenine-specific DNA methylase
MLPKKIEFYCNAYSKIKGEAQVADANQFLTNLEEGDLVFLDPPYSGVHYSRFYHVLESIASGKIGSVSGSGRYPPYSLRPQSKYSNKGSSLSAINDLLFGIASKNASAIITFPLGLCSNGLSGSTIKQIASQYFAVKKEVIKGRFSTLGGNNHNRPARQNSEELVLMLAPR